jgi:acyl dehydratase
MAVNYGLNRVRFPAPAMVGGSVRLTARIAGVTPVEGGVQLVATATVDTDRGGKPCCVADTVSRLYPA